MIDFDLLKINKFFAYQETPRGKNQIEYGWVLVDKLMAEKVVISRNLSDPTDDNATKLSDYEIYFQRFTGISAEEYIRRPFRELRVLLETKHPDKTINFDFMAKLARLIYFNEKFQMGNKTYEVYPTK